MSNPKERHEHALVVEAIQEHLQPLVTGLSIAPQPGLCRLSNIQHLRTTIEGILPEHRRLLAVVEALHPTPALGGRPRHLALSLINQAESVSRGWYGAPIGWIDWRGNGLFAVAIRSAISVGAETLLYAGAGIVADSIPEKEWQETELKFNPLMEALETV
jgi:isochorismate synthase EntC